MTSIFTNIKLLVNTRQEFKLLQGNELKNLPCIEDAYLIIEGEEIAEYGSMSALTSANRQLPTEINVCGKYILPCWCDSHTHLVYAGSRENEFVDKIQGLSYAAIAAKGGGILNSAKKFRETTEEELFGTAWERLQELTRLGTGAVEIKSGYGLTTETELKMLRVIKKLRERSNTLIRSTFLGAHTYPLEYKDDHQGYIDKIIHEMLPVIASEKLADYVDVFCDKGFFSAAETETICKAAMVYGLKPKLHVNQLNSIGGIETGIKLNALSLDHLETLTENDIQLLSRSSADGTWKGTCTLLPTAAFFLRMPLQPARQLIDAGCAVALASDYNPGSSPSGNMNLVVAMSCIQMKMLPEEAINAATINGAFAMELEKNVGTITAGKKANLILTKVVPSLAYLPYSFGSNLIEKVMIRGEWVQ
ncbi:MAG: imidazolonepropionase [Chitinophagaceae bacterium]|nr:imidazolonepropionase [Chitinophagaceae bacterium]